ncbi:MAG: hypothetical protein PHP32_04625, partial [Candidatus Izemoplasmatales bacterium]|nr:hypothetical protein [Candidatus Izemoplasmatales bacterium]
DLKLDHNHFATMPSSIEDLSNPLHARNVFFRVNQTLWSVTNQTPSQKLHPDHVTVENGLLYQRVLRETDQFSVEITSFVPSRNVLAELHKVVFKNTSKASQLVKPVIGVPLFSRSADNLRDHRHVTSLLNRVIIENEGIVNRPTLSFDERGHQENHLAYGVFARSNRHSKITGFWPRLDQFVGQGADLFYPDAAVKDLSSPNQPGDVVEGYEAIGGLAFDEIELAPNAQITLLFGILLGEESSELSKIFASIDVSVYDEWLEETKAYWKKKFSTAFVTIGDQAMTGWYRAVGTQPLIRRVYGNSFLPHHDYGRGGRGWRDLWQDSLALILKSPLDVRENIVNYFKGVRIDGSNATIIGDKPGEFVADRNKIVRVWSDHGAWPFLTTHFYIKRTGDLSILLEEQGYFQDKFTHYTKRVDPLYVQNGSVDLNSAKGVYQGTLLEHILVQNLTAYYNVGDHGNIRIEDADWNDGFDMAAKSGETVAFTHLYIGNLKGLIQLLHALRNSGRTHIKVFEEFQLLMNKQVHGPLSPQKKREKLLHYFDTVAKGISGETIEILIEGLIKDLEVKIESMESHLNQNEWMTKGEDGCFNGYYDNDGQRVCTLEGPVRLTLTGQVFPLMAKNVPSSRLQQLAQTTKKYLYSDTYHSYHLNTRFGENKMNLGRFMGFAYGHKENGAFFSHMTIMYAYSLFENGLVKEASEILDEYIPVLLDIQRSKILPGIPEYIDPEGRGLYHFLTGSASWVVITLVEQLFGIHMEEGKIFFQPKLSAHHFAQGEATCPVVLVDKEILVRYLNPDKLEYADYEIVSMNKNSELMPTKHGRYQLSREDVVEGDEITLVLGRKQ